MNRDIQELREVVQKLVPLLAGKGLTVTQRGSQAYVQTNPATKQPELVNIPNIPDTAEPDFIRAIQGFIDHEVGHVLITDWHYYGRGPSARELMDPKVQRFQTTHNIVEDTMIEKEMVKIFPGAERNISDLRKHFIEKVSKKALKGVTDPKKQFLYLLVPAVRALSGHVEFQDFMDAGDYWKNPYVDAMVKAFKPATLELLQKATTTKETLVVAEELELILHPPAPPKPEPKKAEPPKPPEPKKEPPKPAPAPELDDEDEKEEDEPAKPEPKKDPKPEPEEDEGDEDEAEPAEDADEDQDEGDEEDPADPAEDEDDAGDEEEDEEAPPAGAGDGDEEREHDEPGDEDSDDEGDAPGEADDDAEEGDDAGGSAAPDEDETDAGEDAGDEDEGADEDDGAAGLGGTEEDEGDDGEDAGDLSPGDMPKLISDGDEGGGVGNVDTEEDEDGESGGGGVGNEAAKSIFDFDDDAFEKADMSSQIAILISDEAVLAMNPRQYNVFTRELDQIEPIVPPDMNKKWVPEMEDEVRTMTGRMQKDIERLMASQSHVIRTPGHRRGKLHAPSLYRVGQGDPRVFSQKEEHVSKDTAVSLVCDNSGSMGGPKMKLAMTAAYALCSTLDRVKINHEVIGFTTGNFWGAPQSVRDAMQKDVNAATIRYDRVEPIIMPIYKEFGERITSTVKKRFAYMMFAQNGLNGNIDGESLEYAAIRLMKQREKRKVMIVLSDGQPAGSNKSGPHLSYMVKHLEKSGIEMLGIGIKSEAVKKFYPNHVVLDDITMLPTQVMGELRRILA
jgi:cobalamin biosynthesis protein CobT